MAELGSAKIEVEMEVKPIDVPGMLRRNARALLDAAERIDGTRFRLVEESVQEVTR